MSKYLLIMLLTLGTNGRSARGDTLRDSIGTRVAAIIQAAGALDFNRAEVLWHVDAFYLDPLVAAKLTNAAKTELAERGRKVSERVPLLAAGDLSVLSGMSPREVFPVACARYQALGSLGENEAFLALIRFDSPESDLHAGVCWRGAWRWLH